MLALTSPFSRAGSVAAPYEIGTWEGFRPAAISYTFDDNLTNQYYTAVPMFHQAGFKITLFTIIDYWTAFTWSMAQTAASYGDEIGSHTVTHTSLDTVSAQQLTNELANSQSTINSHITNESCVTLAYPNCAVPNENVVAQYYIAARGCSGQLVPSTPPDFMNISSFILGNTGSYTNGANINSLADSAVTNNAWCVYLTHAIDGDNGYSPLSSAALQASVIYMSTNQGTFWVETFGNVVRYIKERNASSVAETANTGGSITVQVTNSLENSIYNYPITIRRPMPANWPAIAISQNGQPITAQLVTVNSTNYVMFDAVPNGGDVVLTTILLVQFTANPTNGAVPLTVQFTSPSIDSQGNAITQWNWNFGDGSTSTLQNPSHTYTTAGTFNPYLIATNSIGFVVLGSGPSITVSFTTVQFTASPTNGAVPLTVQFTSPSIDSQGNAITQWNWNFGDGSTSALQNPSHTYTTAGAFNPNLIATNSIGFEVLASGPSITVSLTTVQFTASPIFGGVPLTVQFTSPSIDSQGNAITQWNWNFGDGSASTLQNPSHAYTTVGAFNPKLIATNNYGIEVLASGPASITTSVYSGLVLNGDFETGDFTDWTLSGDSGNISSDTLVDNGFQSGFTPYSENYEALLGTSGSLGYLSQTLSTTAGATYLLSFWLNNVLNDPNVFIVSWNGNTLLDTTNLEVNNWTNLQFMATAAGTSTVLQFGFEDNVNWLCLDEVSVAPVPGIASLSLSGTNLVINGSNGFSGTTCYVLMSTNVALPYNQWTPVATNMLNTSGNFSITATNAVNPTVPQSFYILQMQ